MYVDGTASFPQLTPTKHHGSHVPKDEVFFFFIFFFSFFSFWVTKIVVVFW